MPEVALLEARREVRNLGWGLGQHERLLRDEEALLLSEGRLISLIPPRSPGSVKPCPSNNWDTRQRPLISSKEFTVLELVVKVPVTTLLKQCKLIIKCKLWLKSLAELQVNSRYNDSGYNIIPVCTYKLLWSRTKHDHSHTILDVYNIIRYNIILVITTKINRPTGS